MRPNVKHVYLDRGARRALVGLAGEGRMVYSGICQSSSKDKRRFDEGTPKTLDTAECASALVCGARGYE